MINFSNPTDSEEWKSDAALKTREAGVADFPSPPVEPAGDDRTQLPAGGSRWAVEPQHNVIGLINQSFRAFHFSFDEAVRHSKANAEAMRRDLVVMGALRDAQLPVTQLSWHLEPEDETDPAQVKGAQLIQKAIKKTHNLQQFHLMNLEAIFFGRAGTLCTYRWDKFETDLMIMNDWLPIHGDSLIPRWSSGDWGMLVGPGFEGETSPYSMGRVHWFTPQEREAVVIHVHEPEAPDYYETLKAGSIRGVGVRGRTYWWWWMLTNMRALLMDLVERTGSGVWLSYFDQSNPTGRSDMEQAIAAYRDKRVLSIPRDKEGRTAYGLEIKEPSLQAIASFRELIAYYESELKDYITGHSINPGSTIRIGGDPTGLAEGAISRTTRYHAVNLQETYNRQWLPVLAKYMTPGIPPPKWVFEIETPNAELVAKGAELVKTLGGEIDLDQLREVFTLRKPQPGSQIASSVQSLSPVAMDQGVPQGVPVAGNTPQAPQPAQSPITSQPVVQTGDPQLSGTAQ